MSQDEQFEALLSDYSAKVRGHMLILDKANAQSAEDAKHKLLAWVRSHFESAHQRGYEAGLEAACKALCEWCRQGNPISEPLYGRVNETWHIPFPDVPEDKQRVRCQADAIRALPRKGVKEMAKPAESRAPLAIEQRVETLETALRDLIEWLDNDTLEIMKDTIKMGITFDWTDCQSLRERIEKARAVLLVSWAPPL